MSISGISAFVLGRGIKSSRSKGSSDLESFASKQLCSLEWTAFPSTNGRGQKINLSKAKVRFSGEGSDLSDSVKSLVSTAEKTAGLPRSQGYLLPRNDMGKRAAFTLAEVLITLGIIGVVAAMTLPSLIQNYQKGVALNRLKQTYSQLLVGIEAVSAEFDTLPMHRWSCEEGPGDKDYDQESCFYLVPKKLGAKMYERVEDADKVMCYEGKPYRPYKKLDGTALNPFTTYSWSARFPNGACILWAAYAYTGDQRGALYIDVDGPYSGYNTAGKDLFIFNYSEANSGKGLGDNGRSIIPNMTGDPLDVAVQRGCSNKNQSGYTCAARIIRDSWQMTKTYPW